ncbi:MAG: FAD-dependent oxidoreductase [Candidatus Omnitrophica bacterium]|nr:FAD-dependent oxidoreductase [Candidatus Omnitrophota bacterium]
MKKNCEVAIIGAGLAGLSCGYHLEKEFCIFEKARHVGGLCTTKRVGDFYFDCDGHLLYFKQPAIKALVNSLLDKELIRHRRNSWIYSKGTYTRYPFQANTFGLPHETIKECLLGLIEVRKNKGRSHNGQYEHFEQWIYHTFGSGYARHFLLPYNRKFWKFPLKQLTCEWLDGFIPVPSVEDSLEGALDDSKKLFGYNHHFWYPVHGGIQRLAEAFKEKIAQGSIGCNRAVGRIDLRRSLLEYNDGNKVSYKHLVSTMPLPELVKISGPHPRKVYEAKNKLKHTSILNVNFGINRPAATKKHWIYFPESDFAFFRIGFMSNFSPYAAPEGGSSVYVEFSYRKQSELNIQKMLHEAKLALRRLGFIDDFCDIAVEDHNLIPYGYIIYDKYCNQATCLLRDYFRNYNITPIGRYGLWRYLSMEDVIASGKTTAEKLNAQ